MIIESFIEGKPDGAGAHLVADYDQSKTFIAENGRRIIFEGPDGKVLHRALQLRKDGYAIIGLSKAVLKAWKMQVGEKVKIEILKDESKYGMPFPEEFEVTLEQDPEAAAAFEALSDGRKRGLLHYADSAKSEASRIKRALELAEKLRNGTLHGDQ